MALVHNFMHSIYTVVTLILRRTKSLNPASKIIKATFSNFALLAETFPRVNKRGTFKCPA